MQPELALIGEKIRARGFTVTPRDASLLAFGFHQSRMVKLSWHGAWQVELWDYDNRKSFRMGEKEALDAIFDWLHVPY
jgi:hypothetical protein